MNVEQPWPEEPAPDWANVTDLCAVVSGRTRLVWGEGNPKAPLAVILDNPGAREDAEGNPYVCGTRLTLRRALRKAHLAPTDIYLTFLFKCRPAGKYDRAEAKRVSLPVLERQMQGRRLQCLVGLGNTVSTALFGDDREVKTLRGAWHEWAGYRVRVGYHPLAARRRPNLFPTLVEDLTAAKQAVAAVNSSSQ